MAERNLFYEQLERESDGDYVEVVRCRDCKHYSPERFKYGLTLCADCDCFAGEDVEDLSEDDFCSRGERRE